MDNKRRLCRLIERFVNDFQGEAVESIYGKGSTIKIHTVDFGVTTNVIQYIRVLHQTEYCAQSHSQMT